MHPAAFIDIKVKQGEYTPQQLDDFIAALMRDEIDDCQVGAWLMAVLLQGMTIKEAAALTTAMASSGKRLNLDNSMPGPIADKHSSGGVGDKLTLILGPLLAAAGIYQLKLSGRGLGHTGGTIDKLESIPGFKCDLSIDTLLDQVRRIGVAIGAQTKDLAPADGKLYAIRDVTATVESIPLIASSIMSKKIAAGAPTIVLDVKCGTGAFMKTESGAKELASLMVEIGKALGRNMRALVTNMNQPLGRAVGNALEVREAIEVLNGGGPPDVRELTLELAAEVLLTTGTVSDVGKAREQLSALLANGSALQKFGDLIEAQGGNRKIIENPNLLGGHSAIKSPGCTKGGWVKSIDPMTIAIACKNMGGGRSRKDDLIDSLAGVELNAQVGDRVEAGQSLLTVYCAEEAQGVQLAQQLENTAFILSDRPIERPILVLERF
jgi:pyrimidine-nucleoside phosphorylase